MQATTQLASDVNAKRHTAEEALRDAWVAVGEARKLRAAATAMTKDTTPREHLAKLWKGAFEASVNARRMAGISNTLWLQLDHMTANTDLHNTIWQGLQQAQAASDDAYYLTIVTNTAIDVLMALRNQ